MTNETFSQEKLFTTSEVLRKLNIPRHRFVYLFDSRKLRSEEFLTLPNGHRIFRESDLEKIKKSLWEVQSR
ncbi:MAG TPA: hypothetical protein ACFYEK_08370 [Candidatus Wunengus sp. YC60]